MAVFVRKSAMSLSVTVSVCVEHSHDRLMHSLEYCVRLRILDTGWLPLLTICITEGLEVKFKFTFVVVDNVLTTWVSTKPGLVY